MRILILTYLFLFALTGTAWSQQGEEPTAPPEEAEPAEEQAQPEVTEVTDEQGNRWTVMVTPVLWLAATKTDIGVGDRSRNVQMSASDALGNFEAGAMGRLEATNGRWGGFADLFFIKLGDESQVGPLGNIPLSINVDNTIWQVAGTYRVVNQDDFDLDVLAGARGYSLDLDVEIKPFTGPAGILRFPGRFRSADISFVDPIIGAKAAWALSERWDFDAYGDVGGFGAGSDLTYRLGANFGYKANDTITLRAGYLLMSFDHSRDVGLDEVRYETTMYGPVLGAGFKF